jgi:carbonic anhydrase/acetyltransferase-like protein (isoleucine patch superfamily)
VLKKLYRQFDYRRTTDHQASFLRKLWLSWKYDCHVHSAALVYYPSRVRLGSKVRISERAMLNYRSGFGSTTPNLVIGDGTKVMPDAKLIPQQGWIRIGKNCTIQYGCLLYGVGGLEIGDDTRIAASTIIMPMNHVFADPTIPIRAQGETAAGIKIGRDVWIGAGVRILDGVDIGDGCIVGAGSVVTKSLEPYTIAVGVPARPRGRRGSSEDAIAVGS